MSPGLHESRPHGCNMCGGIISESLVQLLATEGSTSLRASCSGDRLVRPPHGRGDRADRADAPGERIAAVHRGAGPRGVVESRWHSFDGHSSSWRRDGGAGSCRARGRDRPERRETAHHHEIGNVARVRPPRRGGGREHGRPQALRRDGRGLSGSRDDEDVHLRVASRREDDQDLLWKRDAHVPPQPPPPRIRRVDSEGGLRDDGDAGYRDR